jgi:hypothetical protein
VFSAKIHKITHHFKVMSKEQRNLRFKSCQELEKRSIEIIFWRQYHSQAVTSTCLKLETMSFTFIKDMKDFSRATTASSTQEFSKKWQALIFLG